MPEKVDISMPQDLDLTGGWTLRVTAVDDNGSLVPGVNVSGMGIVADSPTPDTADQLAVGPFALVPGPNA